MKKFVSLLAAAFMLFATGTMAADETSSTTTKNVTVATTPTAASDLQGGGIL